MALLLPLRAAWFAASPRPIIAERSAGFQAQVTGPRGCAGLPHLFGPPVDML
jgi:hypothetical protein